MLYNTPKPKDIETGIPMTQPRATAREQPAPPRTEHRAHEEPTAVVVAPAAQHHVPPNMRKAEEADTDEVSSTPEHKQSTPPPSAEPWSQEEEQPNTTIPNPETLSERSSSSVLEQSITSTTSTHAPFDNADYETHAAWSVREWTSSPTPSLASVSSLSDLFGASTSSDEEEEG